MTAPTYRWVCHVCQAPNEAGIETCAHCRSPAVTTARAIEWAKDNHSSAAEAPAASPLHPYVEKLVDIAPTALGIGSSVWWYWAWTRWAMHDWRNNGEATMTFMVSLMVPTVSIPVVLVMLLLVLCAGVLLGFGVRAVFKKLIPAAIRFARS